MRVRLSARQVFGALLMTAALALITQPPVGATTFVDYGTVCHSGVDGSVCVAVRKTGGHVYGRMGIDAAAGSELCSWFTNLYSKDWNSGLNNFLGGNDGPYCVTGGRTDVLSRASSSSCSSNPFFVDGWYTVNNSVQRDIESDFAWITTC
jgi:hypothetical protein